MLKEIVKNMAFKIKEIEKNQSSKNELDETPINFIVETMNQAYDIGDEDDCKEFLNDRFLNKEYFIHINQLNKLNKLYEMAHDYNIELDFASYSLIIDIYHFPFIFRFSYNVKTNYLTINY